MLEYKAKHSSIVFNGQNYGYVKSKKNKRINQRRKVVLP